MYRKKCARQISFDDFGQPTGMHLDPHNRWIKRADTIPWAEIEDKYALLFPARTGNVAKPVRLVVGALIIQAEYGWSDEETAAMIRENPYMQYFCGYRSYDDTAPPFNPSTMVNFRRRLAAEVMADVVILIEKASRSRRRTHA